MLARTRCRDLAAVLIACGFAALSGCLESSNPVTDAKKGGQDKELCGAWKYKDSGGTLWIMHFGYFEGAIKSPWMSCTVTTNEGTNHTSAYAPCFVSRVGNSKYLNLASDVEMTFDQFAKEAELIEKIHEFTILEYDIKDGALILTPCFGKFVSDAIKNGLIK